MFDKLTLKKIYIQYKIYLQTSSNHICITLLKQIFKMCLLLFYLGNNFYVFYSFIVHLLKRMPAAMFWILNEWTSERFMHEYLNTQYIKYMNM